MPLVVGTVPISWFPLQSLCWVVVTKPDSSYHDIGFKVQRLGTFQNGESSGNNRENYMELGLSRVYIGGFKKPRMDACKQYGFRIVVIQFKLINSNPLFGSGL